MSSFPVRIRALLSGTPGGKAERHDEEPRVQEPFVSSLSVNGVDYMVSGQRIDEIVSKHLPRDEHWQHRRAGRGYISELASDSLCRYNGIFIPFLHNISETPAEQREDLEHLVPYLAYITRGRAVETPEEREIKSFSDIATYGAKLEGDNIFRARVVYQAMSGIEAEEGTKYKIWFTSRLTGNSFYWVYALDGEGEYGARPGSVSGRLPLADQEDLERVLGISKWRVKRQLHPDVLYVRGMEAEWRFEEYDKPKHMAFALDRNLNFVTGQLTVDIRGECTPTNPDGIEKAFGSLGGIFISC